MGFQLGGAIPSSIDGSQPVTVIGPGQVFTGPSEGIYAIRVASTGATGNIVSLYGSMDNSTFTLIQTLNGPGTFLASTLAFRFIRIAVDAFVSPFNLFWNDEDQEVADQDNEAEYEAGIRPPRFDRAVLVRDQNTKNITVVDFYNRGQLIKKLGLTYDLDGDLVEVEQL
jgi:hypothetical protein